ITARDDERWSDPASFSTLPRRIGIVARARESALTLADVCSQSGWDWQWIRDRSQIAPTEIGAFLFDTQAGCQEEYELIANLNSLHPATPIIVLQGFLRAQDELLWKQAGAVAIIAKPFRIRDLLDAIEQSIAEAVLPSGSG